MKMPLVIWAVSSFLTASGGYVTTEPLQDLDGLGLIQVRQEMKLARQPRLRALSIQDGLIVDLRGNVGILQDKWENQVPGGIDGQVPNEVVYDGNENAFIFNGEPITLPGLATSPTAMPDVTFVMWAKLLQASEIGCVLFQSPDYGWSRGLFLRDPRLGGVGAVMAEMQDGIIDFGHGYPTVGTWDHYALTYSAAGPCTVWVNGVKKSRSLCSPGAGNNNEDLLIGALPMYSGHSSEVMISSVGVYNRVLKDSEVGVLSTGGHVRATGDPHCANLRGEHFNVYSVGELEFIAVPREGVRRGEDLEVVATVTPVTQDPCVATLIRMVSVSGGILGGAPALNISVSSGGLAFNEEWQRALMEDTHHERASMHNMSLRTWFNGRRTLVQVDVQSVKLTLSLMDRGNLNLEVFGLDSFGDAAGGLLGLDSHASAATPLLGCADIALVARDPEDFATVTDRFFWHAAAA